MLPTMGQGACTALEDAYVVAKCLNQKSDPIAAFCDYESLRFSRTRAIALASLRSSKTPSSWTIDRREYPVGANMLTKI